MAMYYLKVEDLLHDYKNVEMFHIRAKTNRQHTKHKEMLKEFINNLEKERITFITLEKERKKLRILMYIISKENLMEC